MGIEKDYLMRQLFQLFEVFQKILRFRQKGEKGKAQEGIDQFYKYLAVEKDFTRLNIEELIDYLQIEKNFNHEQLELVAFVLKEQGELEAIQSIKMDFFRKSYFLLDKIERESTIYSFIRQQKIQELEALT